MWLWLFVICQNVMCNISLNILWQAKIFCLDQLLVFCNGVFSCSLEIVCSGCGFCLPLSTNVKRRS